MRIYRNRLYGTAGAQWHIFGLLPTSLSLMGTGKWIVWPADVEHMCIRANGWDLVYDEGDAS